MLYCAKNNLINTMASTAGFEPATPGFIPLRFSSPALRAVCGLDCLFTIKLMLFRCCPFSLYTFLPLQQRGLARDWHMVSHEAFPEFEQIHFEDFSLRRPISLGILCSILLSYADIIMPISLIEV